MSQNDPQIHAAVPEEIQQLKDFWNTHGQRILSIICVILVLFLAYRLFNRWNTGK